jgi:hypothetical protein
MACKSLSNYSTILQLQNDIDRGRTGEKVSAFDPAAAPLGTDDEAAGTPNPPELIDMTRAHQLAIAARFGIGAFAPRQNTDLLWRWLLLTVMASIFAVALFSRLS